MMTRETPARTIWLHLLKVGEYTASPDIREALADVDFANFAATVSDMTDAGTISRRVLPNGRSHEYAVTTTCRVPRNITLREVMEALKGVPVDNSEEARAT